MTAVMPHMTLSIPPLNAAMEHLCFTIEGISSKLILGDKEVDDNATLRALS